MRSNRKAKPAATQPEHFSALSGPKATKPALVTPVIPTETELPQTGVQEDRAPPGETVAWTVTKSIAAEQHLADKKQDKIKSSTCKHEDKRHTRQQRVVA